MKKLVTTFLAGILCLALFLPMGCETNPEVAKGVIESDDNNVTIEFDSWYFTSGAPNNGITFKCTNKETVFECYAAQGRFNWQPELKAITINADETFYWNDDVSVSGELQEFYIDVIKKNDENIVGYAVIGIDYVNHSEYSPKVIKNVKFLSSGITEETVNTLIENAKKS